MKIRILILLFVVGMISCIPDFSRDCVSGLRFYISHNFSTEEFDEKIKNDVHMRIYKDSTLVYSTLIPYSAIRGGKPYEMENKYSGDLNVILWAVPYSDEIPEKIPAGTIGEHKKAKNISMIQIPGREHHYPLGYLYFGEHHLESKINRGTTESYYISMKNTACRVTVKIIDENSSYIPYQQSFRWLELEGIMNELDFELKPQGKEAVVMSGLYYDAEQDLVTSGAVGVLPSAEHQTLKVTVYEDETPLFRIDTKEKAVLGGDVYIIVNGNQGAGIYVDGWRVRTVTIEYI